MFLSHSSSCSGMCVGGSNTLLCCSSRRRVPLRGSISYVVCRCSSGKVFCRGGNMRVLRYHSST